MTPVLRPLALALCFLVPGLGFAQDTREARLAVARDYVTAAFADLDMPLLIEQIWRPIVPQIESSIGKSLTPTQLDEINALYQATFTDRMRDIMLGQDEVMADLLTLEEITALKEFYASPIGRSVMLKLPGIVAKQQPAIMGLVQSTMPSIMPELQKIVAGP